MIQGGRHTLIPADVVCNVDLEFGNFCSIASGLRIVSGQHPPVEHPECVSTFAFAECWGAESGTSYPPSRHDGEVFVGHDVWIGEGVTILEGVTIGSGSIVAAGSMVAKDVPPYGVVAGNPAEIKKYRFPPYDDEFRTSVVTGLLRIAWWNWPDEKIAAELPCMANIEDFLEAHG